MLKMRFLGHSRRDVPDHHLPLLHSFVDVTVGGRQMRSVPVEQIGAKDIAVGEVLGRAGERGVFVYHNPSGKFRFVATVLAIKDGMTFFEAPGKVEAIAGEAQKRSSVRLDTLVSGTWRMAPGGKGVGEFMKGTLRDISRGGCALIVERQCKVGQWLEVKMALKPQAPPVDVVGEIMRVERIPTSGRFSHGLRFHGLSSDQDHAILEFINRKQTELRNRGLA